MSTAASFQSNIAETIARFGEELNALLSLIEHAGRIDGETITEWEVGIWLGTPVG
jgi:hypothetical protein